MNRAETPGVSRVEKLEKIERLASADFSELRDEYVCSWCEIKEGHLITIPYPNSPVEIRRFPYPREAEIVGRVTGVAMRIAEAGTQLGQEG